MAIRSSHDFAKALKAQGLVPSHCRNVELLVPADGAMVLRYEVFVTTDDMAKIAQALHEASDKGDEWRAHQPSAPS